MSDRKSPSTRAARWISCLQIGADAGQVACGVRLLSPSKSLAPCHDSLALGKPAIVSWLSVAGMSSTPGDDDFRNDAPTRHLPIVVCPPTTAGSVSRRAAAPARARRRAGRFILDVVVGIILKSFAISFVVRRTVVTGTPISSAVIETQSNSIGPAFQHVAPAGDSSSGERSRPSISSRQNAACETSAVGQDFGRTKSKYVVDSTRWGGGHDRNQSC